MHIWPTWHCFYTLFLDTLFFSLLYRLYPCFYRYIYSTLARNSSHLSHFIFHYLRDGINTYCFLLLSSTYRYILYFTSIWFALFTFYFSLFERRFKLLLCFYYSLPHIDIYPCFYIVITLARNGSYNHLLLTFYFSLFERWNKHLLLFITNCFIWVFLYCVSLFFYYMDYILAFI